MLCRGTALYLKRKVSWVLLYPYFQRREGRTWGGCPGNRPVRQGCRMTHRTQSSLGSVQGALDGERTQEGTLQNYKGTSSPSSYRIDGGIGRKNKLRKPRDRGRPWAGGAPRHVRIGGAGKPGAAQFYWFEKQGPNAETFVQEKKKKESVQVTARNPCRYPGHG